MSKKNLLVEIGVKDKGATDQLKALTKELKELDKTYRINDETLKMQEKSFEKAQNSQRFFADSLNVTKEKLSVINKCLKENKESIKEETRASEEAKRKLAEYNKENSKHIKALENVKRAKENYIGLVNKDNEAIDRENKKINENKEQITKLSQEIKRHVAVKKALSENKKKNIELIEKEKNKLKDLRLAKSKLVEKDVEYKGNLRKLNEGLKTHTHAVNSLEDKLKEYSKTEKDLVGSVKKHSLALDNLRKKQHTYKTQLNESVANLKKFNEMQSNVNKNLQKDALEKQVKYLRDYNERATVTSQKLQAVSGGFNAVGNALFAISTPILAVGSYGIKSAIDFESAFAGVRKTVDATEPQFKKLENAAISMSERLPKSASEISKIMEIAGQLGIKVDDIEKFSETMIRLGDSTNIASEDAALLLAQFVNITGLDHSQIDKLSSVIVDLGNHTATTEDKIVNLMHNLAGGGKIFGLLDYQIAGLSATMSATGIEAEKGGTAMTKFMISVLASTGKSSESFYKMGEQLGMTTEEMDKQCAKAKKSLGRLATVSGVTSDEFKKLVKENPSEALMKLIEGLGKLQESGEDVAPVLEAIGIKETRLRDTILRLVTGHKHLRENMNMSKKAWEENTALANESNKRYKTVESQLKMLKNQFQNVAREIGIKLLPTLINLMGKAKDLINWFKGLDDSTKESIISYGKLIVTAMLVCKGLGKVTSAISTLIEAGKRMREIGIATKLLEIKGASSEASTAVLSAGKALTSAGGSCSVLTGSFTAFLPVAAGVAAVGATLYAGYKLVDAQMKNNKKTVLESTETYTIWEKIMAKLNGTNVKTRKELEDSGLVYHDTSKLTSDFAESVKASRKNLADLNLELERTNWDGVFNLEQHEKLDVQIQKMIDEAKKTLESGKEDIKKKWQELFSTDGIDENEKETLNFLDKRNENILIKIRALEAEIKKIRQKAKDEKRDNSKEEVAEIEEKLKKIEQLKLESLTKSNEDRIYLEKQFMQEIGNLDLQGASDRLVEQKKIMDNETKEKLIWMDTQIQSMQEKAEKLNGVEKEEALKSIETMKKTRQKIIDGNNEKYEALLNIIKEKYPEMQGLIDEYTGKMLTNEEIGFKKSYDNWKGHHVSCYHLAKSGWNKVVDSTTGATKMVYEAVDEATGKVIASFDSETGKIYANTEESKKAMEGLKQTTDFTHGAMAADFIRLTHGITNSTKLNSQQMGLLREQFGLTKNSAGELEGQITDLNGNPIKIKINKDGTISNIEEIKKKIWSVPEKRSVYINTYHNDYYNSYGGGGTGWHPSHGGYGYGDVGSASGSYYLKGYASGINSLPSFAGAGYVTSRVNEMGFELFDLPKRTNAYFLGTHRGDEIMNLPVGTKITNHIASTNMMLNAVKNEVKKQLGTLLAVSALNNKDSGKENSLKQDITFKFEKVVIKDERDIKELVKAIKYEIEKGVVF